MHRFLIAALMPLVIQTLPAVEKTPAADEQVDTIQIEKLPDEAALPRADYEKTLRAGVDFLLKEQKKDGSWGDHRVIGTWNITCPYPDGPLTFKNASTALCILGLNATPMRHEPAVQQAMERAEDYLIAAMPKLKRGDNLCLYNPWAHTYVLDALSMRAADMDKNSPRYQKLKACAAQQIKKLQELASGKGGWGYITYDGYAIRPASEPTSFMTATVLISLKLAEQSFGLKMEGKHFDRAYKFLKNSRTPAGTYVYSLSHCYAPGRLINRHTGSLARTPSGDYALKIWDDKAVSVTRLEDGLDRLWSRRGWLTMALHKPKPHESFAQNSGYFFYYGYYYTAMCLDMVPQERVKRHAAFLGNDIVRRQCDDGAWWDNPLYNYHKFYGTGYALYALSKSFDRLYGAQPADAQFHPGQLWKDNHGVHINAHGGGILFNEKNSTYYWYGEHKVEGDAGNYAQVGVHCYSSKDLLHWKDEGIALKVVENDDAHPIAKGCILERPKVVYNKKTGKYVMWFHLELKGKGYGAAYAGCAVANSPTGPFAFKHAGRVNPGKWAANIEEKDRHTDDYQVPRLTSSALPQGADPLGIFKRDLKDGQMSRDMTIFIDDDGKAYHIYSSEENSTTHIAELTDDYTGHTGKFVRVFPGRFMEAPAICKHNGKYYFIASGCTGWTPNAARSAVADKLLGPWTELKNPCVGKDADLTFHGQSTYILPVQGKPGVFIFMADIWRPQNAIDGRYMWLPMKWNGDQIILEWQDAWSL